MKFPGLMMLGAQSRLLPPSIPFGFFLAAVLFHVLTWALLVVDAEQAAGFAGGLGMTPAVLHALTLGVMVMTVIGASLQILPVATGQPLRALWPCWLVFLLYVPGTLILLYGFAESQAPAMTMGGGMVAAALAIYGMLVADLFFRTRTMRLFVSHAWIALAALAALAVLGFLLVLDVDAAFLDDRAGTGIAHLILAVYGFMGMTVLGYSQILMPMFAMSEPAPEGPGFTVLGLAATAVVVAVGGALGENTEALAGGAAVGLVAAVAHVWAMDRTLRQGMRRNLGTSFVLVRTGWVFLPLAIIAGGLAAAEVGGDAMVPMFGFLALFGWLLTFILGILQRIIPFLAAMHAAKAGQTPPLLSELAGEGLLRIHAVCHFSALALLGGGIVSEIEMVVTAGALVGLAGALIFLGFTLDVIRRSFAYMKKAAQDGDS